MKKCVFILMLLTANKTSFAQSFITNRECFDFEVGDVFQYEIKSSALKPDYIFTYRQDEITNKWYNTKKDSVFYEFQDGQSLQLKSVAFGPLDSPVVTSNFLKCKPDLNSV